MMKSVMETIELLEKHKDTYIVQQKFLQAAEINKTISDHQTERAQLKEQLQQLVKLANESARHKKRRREVSKPKKTVLTFCAQAQEVDTDSMSEDDAKSQKKIEESF